MVQHGDNNNLPNDCGKVKEKSVVKEREMAIPIRYQQLVLFPCCLDRKGEPHIIHLFGRMQSESKDQEDALKNICVHTRSHPLWNSRLFSDQPYSYLPQDDFKLIDYRNYMYEHWVHFLPAEERSWEDTCDYLQLTLRRIKYNRQQEVVSLSWMYNVIMHTHRVSRAYLEFIQDWCEYIRLDCPCAPLIQTILNIHKKDNTLYYNYDNDSLVDRLHHVKEQDEPYVPLDQWLLQKRDHYYKLNFSRWMSFYETHLQHCYDHIKEHPSGHSFTKQDVGYMVTLPVLWSMLHCELRFIKHVFLDDSMHEAVLTLLREWISVTGCVLCCTYQGTSIQTALNYHGNPVIHVTPIHTHLRWMANEERMDCTIVPTVEDIDKVMDVIPNFMLDGNEDYFEDYRKETMFSWLSLHKHDRDI